ncbi:MAG: threonine/serine exporter family protein [Clostridia bacterium]|nr:threonine/serine exporter family protein [Clostridia bacterium]
MTYIIQILTAGIASLGFAVLYNVRGKRLAVPFIGGILGWTLYLMLMFLNNEILQSLIVSMFLSAYTEIAARLIKTPTTTFLLANMIILIPGGKLYYTISSAIKGDWLNFALYGKETIFMAIAISAGIMVVSSVTKIILSNKK